MRSLNLFFFFFFNEYIEGESKNVLEIPVPIYSSSLHSRCLAILHSFSSSRKRYSKDYLCLDLTIS